MQYIYIYVHIYIYTYERAFGRLCIHIFIYTQFQPKLNPISSWPSNSLSTLFWGLVHRLHLSELYSWFPGCPQVGGRDYTSNIQDHVLKNLDTLFCSFSSGLVHRLHVARKTYVFSVSRMLTRSWQTLHLEHPKWTQTNPNYVLKALDTLLCSFSSGLVHRLH